MHIYQELVNKAKDICHDQTIILVFLNNRYFPIFEIWYNFFKKYKKENLLVISLDKICSKNLKNYSIIYHELPIKLISKRTKKCTLRVPIIKSLIEEGINVIHSDSDAFWLTDISEYFDNCECDLSISIAYSRPQFAVNQWGFSMCCGLYHMRSTNGMRSLLTDYVKECEKENSDQIPLNRLLYQSNVHWLKQSCIENRGRVSKYGITIDVISDNLVSRKTKQGLSVWHPCLLSEHIPFKLIQALEGLEKITDYQERTLNNFQRAISPLYYSFYDLKKNIKFNWMKLKSEQSFEVEAYTSRQ
jgi:hypothetical protein